jgi:uncharacterized delta-60 repeat protein
MRSFILSAFLLLSLAATSQITEQWIAKYDNFGDVDSVTAMTVDSNGNVFVTGASWDGSTDEYDYVTIKYNGSTGAQMWLQEYDNFSGNDIATAIALDPTGNVIVTGMSWDGSTDEYDYVTIKYNGSTGNQMWLQDYDQWSASDKATSVAVDANGDIYVTGAADDGSIDETDIVTIKYSSSGSQIWLQEYDEFSGPDTGKTVVVDAFGYVIVTGSVWSGSVDNHDVVTIRYSPSGAQQWIRVYDRFSDDDFGADVVTDTSGNIYVTGSSWNGGVLEFDIVTISYDVNGVLRWVRLYDYFAAVDRGYAIAIDNSNNIYVGGTSYGGGVLDYDYKVLHYSSNGSLIWQRQYDNFADNDFAYDVVTTVTGKVIVTGSSYGGGVVNEDYTTIVYDTAGTQIWLKEYDNFADKDVAVAVCADAMGNVYVSGFSWDGSIDEFDYVTIKYCEQPTITVADDTLYTCNGDSVQLNVSGGATCTWTPSAGLSSTTSFNPKAAPSVTTNYIVTVRNGTGCPRKDTIRVVVRPVYASSQQVWICSGEQYMFPDSTVSDSAQIHVSALQSIYGCDSVITTTLNVDTISFDTTLTLSGATLISNQPSVSYQWLNCATQLTINGATNQSFLPATNGTYAVILSGTACTDTSECVQVLSVGTVTQTDSAFYYVFPNPAHTAVNIKSGESNLITSIDLLDASGRTVFQGKYNNVNSVELDLSPFASGSYVVRIMSANHTRYLQLVKE